MIILRAACFPLTPLRRRSFSPAPTHITNYVWQTISLGMALHKRRLETPREMFATMA